MLSISVGRDATPYVVAGPPVNDTRPPPAPPPTRVIAAFQIGGKHVTQFLQLPEIHAAAASSFISALRPNILSSCACNEPAMHTNNVKPFQIRVRRPYRLLAAVCNRVDRCQIVSRSLFLPAHT
jgi:hypothetical protein